MSDALTEENRQRILQERKEGSPSGEEVKKRERKEKKKKSCLVCQLAKSGEM